DGIRDFHVTGVQTCALPISADGNTVYGQLFEPKGNAKTKRPAVVFIHGGPQRQMLLGWHYGDYYANAYALNQYLVSKGFVVLSVNYRLGIGSDMISISRCLRGGTVHLNTRILRPQANGCRHFHR